MHRFYLGCDVDQGKQICLPVHGFSFVANLADRINDASAARILPGNISLLSLP